MFFWWLAGFAGWISLGGFLDALSGCFAGLNSGGGVGLGFVLRICCFISCGFYDWLCGL